jgi:hypothetical protein
MFDSIAGDSDVGKPVNTTGLLADKKAALLLRVRYISIFGIAAQC